MSKLKTKMKLAATLAVPVAAAIATSEALKIRKYTISSPKITSKINAVLITDLHSTVYGDDQKKLVKAIDKQKPDVIFIAGDIIDDDLCYDGAIMLIDKIGKKYPCYYVPGNHEHRTGEVESIKRLVASYGIKVLAGEGCTAFVAGQPIYVSGADEMATEKARRRQFIRLNNEKDDSVFTVLLSHNPKHVKYYNMCDFDLVLCGHAHGGQVRIPGIVNGLYSPGQGIFPKYAGGFYNLDSGCMIVSRGLAKDNIPRVFNRPELVVISLISEELSESE